MRIDWELAQSATGSGGAGLHGAAVAPRVGRVLAGWAGGVVVLGATGREARAAHSGGVERPGGGGEGRANRSLAGGAALSAGALGD